MTAVAGPRRGLPWLAGVLLGIALALGGFVLLAAVLPVPPRDPLRQAAALLVLPAMLVLAMAGATSLARGVAGALDPLTDPETRALRLNQRVLANTVEQAAVFCPALLAAGAAGIGGPSLTAATLVFVLARLAFWAGYAVDPLWRGPGMAATIAIEIALIAVTLLALLG
ncbi:MAPEG family protein [Arenibaculum pallidiluteum]|uniref:MAPEG family protein n=1 Tax=Arenibaculum pallidiluteum TaxID=2812559 RepID=UPI001A95954A|nr:MAPEG family protein [Arenibaculum pallidiluteum]